MNVCVSQNGVTTAEHYAFLNWFHLAFATTLRQVSKSPIQMISMLLQMIFSNKDSLKWLNPQFQTNYQFHFIIYFILSTQRSCHTRRHRYFRSVIINSELKQCGGWLAGNMEEHTDNAETIHFLFHPCLFNTKAYSVVGKRIAYKMMHSRALNILDSARSSFTWLLYMYYMC